MKIDLLSIARCGRALLALLRLFRIANVVTIEAFDVVLLFHLGFILLQEKRTTEMCTQQNRCDALAWRIERPLAHISIHQTLQGPNRSFNFALHCVILAWNGCTAHAT